MKYRNILAATVVLASITSLTGCGETPNSVVEGFYRSVESGETTKAKKYLSSQMVGILGETKLSTLLAAQTEKIRECGGIKNIEINLEGEGEVRSGSTIISFSGNCSPRDEKIKLIKEDGKWKITASK